MPTSEIAPDDVLAVARRFDVDLAREPFLLPLLREVALTPKMPAWKREGGDTGDREDEAGRFIREQIERLRGAHQEHNEGDDPTWMAFVDGDGEPYYFDFGSNTRQSLHPLVRLVGEPGASGGGAMVTPLPSSSPSPVIADPRAFENAAALHRQSTIKDVRSLEILCFRSWWTETSPVKPGKSSASTNALVVYFSIPTRHFQVARVDESAGSVFTISHSAHPVSGRALTAFDLHEGARVPLLGRLTTLRQATLLTRQWLASHARVLSRIQTQLRDELAKYAPTSSSRTRTRVGASPKRGARGDDDADAAMASMSLRALLDDVRDLQTQLTVYRPDVARRLCAPLLDLDPVWID